MHSTCHFTIQHRHTSYCIHSSIYLPALSNWLPMDLTCYPSMPDSWSLIQFSSKPQCYHHKINMIIFKISWKLSVKERHCGKQQISHNMLWLTLHIPTTVSAKRDLHCKSNESCVRWPTLEISHTRRRHHCDLAHLITTKKELDP